MNDIILQVYHHLPSPLRALASSIHGVRLRRWRYGQETEELTKKAVEKENWNHDRWKSWQEQKLSYVLHRAATRVPYYREQWAARRRHGDSASWEYLENWPILNKQTIQSNPRAFVADDYQLQDLYYDHTSGTTGTPLDLWFSKEAIRGWFALWEVRARGWNGLNRHNNWATLGGQLVVPPGSEKAPFWVWNVAMRQLYMSANHISQQNTPAYIDALNRYGITHIVGYSFSVAALAREARELGLAVPSLQLVITIAEPLLSWQRDALKTGFRCEVRESYGMAELVAAASECPAGTLHLWPETGWLEIFSDKENLPLHSGETGRFIATGLMNTAMPLIRYEIGDRGALSRRDRYCSCGRLLPILSSVEGRMDDVLYTEDGRLFGRLDPVFKAHLPIREAQIVQETLGRVRIRYVPTQDFTERSRRLIIDRLRARMGPVEVIMEPVAKVPRESNGKYRPVVNMMNRPSKDRM